MIADRPQPSRLSMLARYWRALPMAALLLLASCIGTHNPAKPPPILRNTFFFYYVNALWHAKKLDWQTAEKNYRIALGEIPGAQYGVAEDTERVKTYGTHYERDYYPNRELGVSLYHQAQTSAPSAAPQLLREASDYLQRSLKDRPTDRAQDYLRRTQAAIQTAGIRQAPPAIRNLRLDARAAIPDTPIFLPTNRTTVTGEAHASAGIETLFVAGSPVLPPENASGNQLSFRREIILPADADAVTVEARDFAGAATTQRIPVVIDWQSPQISIRASATPGAVEVVVIDNHGLAEAVVNDRPCPIASDKREFRIPVTLGDNPVLTIRATDLAGNTVRESRNVADLAQSLRNHQDVSGNVQLAAADANKLPARTADNLPPTIVFSPEEDRRVIHDDWILLDVAAEDHGGLARLEYSLDDDNWHPIAGATSSLRERAVMRIPIADPDNVLTVRAVDATGNQSQRRLTVHHRPPARTRESLRLRAALAAPVTHVHDEKNTIGRSSAVKPLRVQRALADALVNARPRRIRLLDVRTSTLKVRVQEGTVALRGDPRAAFRLDAASAPDWILYGYATFWSGADEWDLQLFYKDLESGAEAPLADVSFHSRDPRHVHERMAILAEKVRQRLPHVSFPLPADLDAKGEFRLPNTTGLLPGMHFVLLTESEFGDPILADGKIAEAVVRDVDAGACRLRLLSPTSHKGSVAAVAR